MARKRKRTARRKPARRMFGVTRKRRTRRKARRMGIPAVAGTRKKKRSHKRRRTMSGNPASAAPIIVQGVSMARRKRSRRKSYTGKRRARRTRRARYMGGAFGGAGGNLMKLAQTGALTVVGAGAGSMLAARVPLPDPRLKPILPIAAGLALGASKFGRKPMLASVALGMVVAGGLALGRTFAPQFFAGEDEMLLGYDDNGLLGIPAVSGEEAELLGIPAVAGDEDEFAGEDYLDGEFATSADL